MGGNRHSHIRRWARILRHSRRLKSIDLEIGSGLNGPDQDPPPLKRLTSDAGSPTCPAVVFKSVLVFVPTDFTAATIPRQTIAARTAHCAIVTPRRWQRFPDVVRYSIDFVLSKLKSESANLDRCEPARYGICHAIARTTFPPNYSSIRSGQFRQ